MKRIFAGVALAVTIAGCGVSTQQEVQMGQQAAAEINSQLPLVRDAEINRYINVLGDSIANVTSRADLDWHFFIVDSREVNAFAVPGGFVYVNRGLIERSPQLMHLASVLGHEIGHVVERHSVEQMEKAQGANIAVTLGCVLTSICNSGVGQTAINAAGGAIFAKFSRDDEREADRVGIQNVVRAGIHPQGAPEMFQILLAERQRNPSAVESWFATHPTEEDRIRETAAMINTIDPNILRTLTKDTPAYQNFKRRIQALPPSPTVRR
jgi:predicted Zn-dependent protease